MPPTLPPSLWAAWLLLTPPPGDLPPEPDPGLPLAALRRLAVEWELADPGHEAWMLADPEYAGQLPGLLRRRHADFADAPRLEEARRLPPHDYLDDCVTLNRALRLRLEALSRGDAIHGEEWRELLLECDRLYRLYDRARDARCREFCVTTRRAALRDLRRALGADFLAGRLPPPVPLNAYLKAD